MEVKKGLKGKDLIAIGIYAAIYFVINFAFMLFSALHPVLWILMPCLIAVFAGIPFMMMCTKVQKSFAVLLMGIVVALIYFFTGQFTIYILATFVIGCVVAEVVRKIVGFTSYQGNTLAYMAFSVGMIGSPLPVWLMHDQFMNQIRDNGMPEAYVSNLEKVSSPVMLIVMIVGTLAGALLGAFITKKMFKKHFEKAGVV